MAGYCVGVDGCKGGWIAVWREEGAALCHRRYATPSALVECHRQADIVAVDIPLGLAARGDRRADPLARRYVGGHRAPSVFVAPIRPLLGTPSRAEADRISREVDGRGVGAQALAIFSKVDDWDRVLRADAAARALLREVHPEVSFALLNGGAGRGLVSRKRRPDGQAERIALLSAVFPVIAIEGLLAAVPRREAARDDVLDALVALWSAERIRDGVALSLPEIPETDPLGLPMAIRV